MITEKLQYFSLKKLQTIQVCLPEAYGQIEKQLQDTVEKIYLKTVPTTVRKYIESVMKLETTPKKQRAKCGKSTGKSEQKLTEGKRNSH